MQELRRIFGRESSSGDFQRRELKREAAAVKFYQELPKLGLGTNQPIGELMKIHGSAWLDFSRNLTSEASLDPHLEIQEGRTVVVLENPRVKLGGVTSLKIGLENALEFTNYAHEEGILLVPYIHFTSDRTHPSRFAKKHGIEHVSFYLMTTAQFQELRSFIGVADKQ